MVNLALKVQVSDTTVLREAGMFENKNFKLKQQNTNGHFKFC